MNYLPFLAFAAFAAAVIALIVFSVRYDRKLGRARVELAARRGWRYEPGEGQYALYTLEGSSEGGSWRVEARRGGRNRQGATLFRCAEASIAGVVYIGPAGMATFLKSGMGQKLAKWGLSMGLNMGAPVEDLERLLDNPVELETGDPEFSKAFAVLATESRLAQRLVTPRVREALLNWPPTGAKHKTRNTGLSSTWSSEGLTLTWPADLKDPEMMAAFAEIGQTMLAEVRRSW